MSTPLLPPCAMCGCADGPIRRGRLTPSRSKGLCGVCADRVKNYRRTHAVDYETALEACGGGVDPGAHYPEPLAGLRRYTPRREESAPVPVLFVGPHWVEVWEERIAADD